MKTRTIAIILFVFGTVIALFFALMLILANIRSDNIDRALKEKEQITLSESGMFFRYCEGLDPNVNSLSELNDCGIVDEENIQISVYADGNVEVKHIIDPTPSTFSLGNPTYRTRLPDEKLKELKDKIGQCGIRIVGDSDYYYQSKAAKQSVLVSRETEYGSGIYILTKEMCEDCKDRYPVYSQRCAELIDFASELLTEEDKKQFSKVVSEWHTMDPYTYDFSESGNDYLHEGDFEGYDTFRYYEELYHVDSPDWQDFMLCIGTDADGRVNTTGSYSVFDRPGVDRFREAKDKEKTQISREEIKYLQELVQECDFAEYATETPIGYQPPAYAVNGKFETVRYFTVACNGSKYYAIDDGTNPKLRRLIDEYLRITTNGLQAEDSYSTTKEYWDSLSNERNMDSQ